MKSSAALLALLALLVLLVFIPLTSSAFVEKTLEGKLSEVELTEVVVELNSQSKTDNSGNAFRQVSKSKEQEVEIAGFKLERRLKTVNFGTVKIKKKDLNTLASSKQVKAIYENKQFKALLLESIPIINSTTIQSRRPAGINSTGAKETVCVVDTGVNYNHSNLGGCFGNGCKVIAGYDFVNSDFDPIDDNGHGTHVAGIIAANGSLVGVAPGAQIAAIKVLNSAGQGNLANLLSGIDWCNDNAQQYNISVISISIGDGGQNSPSDAICTVFDALFQTAQNQSITVVTSSGNDAYANGLNAPACSQYAVSVGATYDNGLGVISWGNPVICTDTAVKNNVTCFTNRNEYLKLLAPGALINSTYQSTFANRGGTSQAAPHVSGVAALINSDQKNERGSKPTPQQLLVALNATGTFTQDPTNATRWFPIINAYSALLYLDNTSSRALSVNYTNNSWTNLLNVTAVFEMNEFVNCTYTVNNTSTQALGNISVSTYFNTNITTSKNVTLNCTDQAQNIGINTLFFNTDYAAPNSTVNYAGNLLNSSSNITIIPSDEGDSQVNNTFYCVDANATCDPIIGNGLLNSNSTLQSPFNFTLNSSSNSLRGNLTIRVSSIDNAGNVQVANTTNITVNSLPLLLNASPSNTAIAGGANITIYTISSDLNQQNITIYICTSNTSCIGNSLATLCVNTSSYNTSCTYVTPVENSNFTAYVFAFDDFNESSQTNLTVNYTTSIVTPQIYNFSITNITTTTVEIAFTSSMQTRFNFSFGATQGNLNLSFANSSFSTNHNANLTSLAAQTFYYFNLTAVDEFGNLNSTTGNFRAANTTNFTTTANSTLTINFTSYNVQVAAVTFENSSFNLTISNPVSNLLLGNFTYVNYQWQIVNITNDFAASYNLTFYFNASEITRLNVTLNSLKIFKLNSSNQWEEQNASLNLTDNSALLENASPARYALAGLLDDNQTCTYSTQCSNYNCALDYDGQGAFCTSNNYCSHDGFANYSTPLCYSNNLYTCAASTWILLACEFGCSNSTCISIQTISIAASNGGGSSNAVISTQKKQEDEKPKTATATTQTNEQKSKETQNAKIQERIFKPNEEQKTKEQLEVTNSKIKQNYAQFEIVILITVALIITLLLKIKTLTKTRK